VVVVLVKGFNRNDCGVLLKGNSDLERRSLRGGQKARSSDLWHRKGAAAGSK